MKKRVESSNREAPNEKKTKSGSSYSTLFQGLQKTERQVKEIFGLIPTPLAERLSPFRGKLDVGPGKARLTLRQRVDNLVSLLCKRSTFFIVALP